MSNTKSEDISEKPEKPEPLIEKPPVAELQHDIVSIKPLSQEKGLSGLKQTPVQREASSFLIPSEKRLQSPPPIVEPLP